LRDERVAFIRRLSVDATDTLMPGAEVVPLTRRKAEPAFLAQLRRAYTDVPDPDSL
jgi:hypothetical protein